MEFMTKKFLSAAFCAALVLSSCSNEVEDTFSPSAPLPEGVTRMVFTFGERGVTPYRTRAIDNEDDLSGLTAFFMADNGSNKPLYLGNVTLNDTESSVSFDIGEEYYGKTIKAFLMRGLGVPVVSVPIGAEVDSARFINAVAADDFHTAVASSKLPISARATFQALGGTQTASVAVSRRVGKVSVKAGALNGVTADAVTVKTISLINTVGGGGFFVDQQIGNSYYDADFTINQKLDQLAKDQGLVYAYHTDVKADITDPKSRPAFGTALKVVLDIDGQEMTRYVGFAPEVNHKYVLTININASTPGKTEVDMKVNIKDWVEGEEGSVDFNY